MAPSITPREVRRLASDHDFVLGAHPTPRRLGWWPFVATHLSLPAALGAGIICVVVSIVFTSDLSKQMLECPAWANNCKPADSWTAENLGTIQGIIALVYLIGMLALGYATLGVCEATIWPLLQMQSFSIKGLNAYLSTTRGSIMSAPAAVMAVRSLAAGLVLVCALVVTMVPFVGIPLGGYAFTTTLQHVQLESNYTSGGGIAELYAQTNPPTSVMTRVLGAYSSWAGNTSSEPMPEYREWYIDRETLSERGSFVAMAVRLQTIVSCRPHSVQQMVKDNLFWNAFLTNMTHTNNNSTVVGEKNSTGEVWVRVLPQLTVWADDFEFLSEKRTRTTLVFAALNGTIEGGSTTPLFLGDLTSVSSIACDVDIEGIDDILRVGDNPPETANLPVLSSLDTLTLSPAASPSTYLNELLLWFTVSPLLASPSVDGTQPAFFSSSPDSPPLPLTTFPSPSPQSSSNTYTLSTLTHFIRLSIGVLAQSTIPSPPASSQPNPNLNPATVLTSTTPILKLSRTRPLILLFPPLLTTTLLFALALYTTHLHARLNIPVMRQWDLGEILKSAQTNWMREQAGVDAAKSYLPSELAGMRVRFGVEREGAGLGMGIGMGMGGAGGTGGVAGLVCGEGGDSEEGEGGKGSGKDFGKGFGKERKAAV